MSANLGLGQVYTTRVKDSVNSGKGVFSVDKVHFEEDDNGKVIIDGVRCRVIGNGHTEPSNLPAKTMRFKFYDETVDPTQWEDVWNIGATWTKVEDGVYDWHYDNPEWAAKYSGSGASSTGNSALATYRYSNKGNWLSYLTNVDLDIIDSDLTGVTTVYQLFNVANGVHHCSLKHTGSVQNWSMCFANPTRNVKLESLDPLDMSSVDVTKFGSSAAMFGGARYIRSPIVLNMPNATSLKYLFAGTNTSSSTLTLNLSSAFTGATASVLGSATFDEVIIPGTTGMTSARYFSSSKVKKYTWTDWNTAGVDCSYMFQGCTNLTEVSLPYNAKVTNASSMFKQSASLSAAPALDLSSCTSTESMFDGCSSLTYVPSNYDVSASTSAVRMFFGCSALTHIPSYVFTSATSFGNFACSCTALIQVPVLTCPAATSTPQMFRACPAVESGASNMYNYLSTKPVAVTSYSNTFTDCGSGTATGIADLATIPDTWGGLYIPNGTLTCSRKGGYYMWSCDSGEPVWRLEPALYFSSDGALVPSDYDGVGFGRDRVTVKTSNLSTDDSQVLYARPAFFQVSSDTGNVPFTWLLTTSTPISTLPVGTEKVDIPKDFDSSTTGPTDSHFGTLDTSSTVYFGFLVTDVASLSGWSLSSGHGLIWNTSFRNFTLSWSLT